MPRTTSKASLKQNALQRRKIDCLCGPARPLSGDGCAIAHGLALIGARWSLLILLELSLGPRSFSELKRGVDGISANVLARRLRELVGAGLVRRTASTGGGRGLYEASEWATEIDVFLNGLSRWASSRQSSSLIAQ